MKHQIILIDGHSTVGKSTLSKSLFRQIARQKNAFWLHEETRDHPIRQGEFQSGDFATVQGMEQNRREMLARWHALAKTIHQDGRGWILEGCFLHSIDRYLLYSPWDANQRSEFFQAIWTALDPLDPLLILLYRPDLRRSFEEAFRVRGQGWKDLILQAPEPRGYFKDHPYTGDDSVFDCIDQEQHEIQRIFTELPGEKLKIDTSAQEWESYVRRMTEAAGCRFEKEIPAPFSPRDYTGRYRDARTGDIWTIGYDRTAQCLYTSLFWPYMPMSCLEKDRFELISFPVVLDFSRNGTASSFIVRGSYDWGYNGSTFFRLDK